eukprot:m51a1_g5877 hypothetical protein (364) ;mRNA; r:499911-501170
MEWVFSACLAALWVAGWSAAIAAVSLRRRFYLGPYEIPRLHVARIGLFVSALATLALLWLWAVVWGVLRGAGALRWSSWVEQPAAIALLASSFVFVVVALLYARFLEPRWLATRFVRVGSTEGPALRIVVFSDTHVDGRRVTGAWRSVPGAVNALRPDAVVFLGDTLNDVSGLRELRGVLSAIRAPLGKLAVKGNWDVWYWRDVDLLEGTGFEWLDSDARDSMTVVLAGVSYRDELGEAASLASSLLERRAGGEWRVLAYHSPDVAGLVDSADLVVAGHLHGGQLHVPLVGPLAVISRHGTACASGLHRVDCGSWLYATTGVGVEPLLPYRLNCRPEVVALDFGTRTDGRVHITQQGRYCAVQ